jgi:hypothetical protein
LTDWKVKTKFENQVERKIVDKVEERKGNQPKTTN